MSEETSPLHSHGSGGVPPPSSGELIKWARKPRLYIPMVAAGFPAVRVHEKKFRGVVKWSRRAYLYFQLSTMNSCQGIMIIQEGS